jgi:sulfide:quinone oxidoreductase
MAGNGQPDGKSKVLIAGGGVAGLEAALALRDLAGESVEVEVRDPRREFVFRPFAVGEPYGRARIFRYDLRRLAARCGAGFSPAAISSADPRRHLAVSLDGERIYYDHLIVANGVRMLWSVPGTFTFWGVADEGPVGGVIADLRAGQLRSLVFTMPGGCNWALPLYELALLGVTELAKGGERRTRLTIVTPEDAPLEIFGRRAAEQMAELLEERGIEVVTGAHPVKFEDGRLRIAAGEDIAADAVISLPRLDGRRIAGIPHDPDGFIGVDEHCRAIGVDDVFAVGDVSSFPIKQGGVATQQADAAAEAIAAASGVEIEPKPFDPIMRGVLWTDREPRYLSGRPTGGHGEASSLSERPPWPGHEGKVIGRYLSPLLELLEDEAEADSGGRPELRLTSSAEARS